MYPTYGSDDVKKQFKAALGMGQQDHDPAWPLPNMKPATEVYFWSRYSSHSWQSEAWLGHKKHEGTTGGTVRVFFSGKGGYYANGGMAVLYAHRYGEEKVHYFTWSACDHDWDSRNAGHCLTRYTCKKCKSTHDVDSSG